MGVIHTTWGCVKSRKMWGKMESGWETFSGGGHRLERSDFKWCHIAKVWGVKTRQKKQDHRLDTNTVCRV